MSPKAGSAKEPVLKDVERVDYDLSHWAFQVGAIGSLQGISTIPVVAGDSMELNASIVFRLSPMRRNLYLDTVVDLFAFYVPHRHIYGDDWINFILAGQDEAITFGTDTMAADALLSCVGLQTGFADVLPRWLTRGPIQIWNRYFRDPTDVAGILSEDYFSTLAATNTILSWGLPCAHLKSMSTATVLSTLAAADYSLPLSGGEVNLFELAQLKGRLQTEQARDYYSVRYTDLLKHSWKSGVNTDADKRPTLLMRNTSWLSGYDVDGTDDATLGTYAGKAQSIANLRMPMRFFPEHGTIFIMGLLRFPFVHTKETHYLVTKPQPTYAEIAGDPDLIGRRQPIALNNTDIFVDSSSVALGDIPYAQWYRQHPNRVHFQYEAITGHPFLSAYPTTRVDGIYIGNTEYNNIFSTMQLYHWNCQAHIGLNARRFIPDPQRSIFAGSRT